MFGRSSEAGQRPRPISDQPRAGHPVVPKAVAKRYAVTVDQSGVGHFSSSRVTRQLAATADETEGLPQNAGAERIQPTHPKFSASD